MCWPRQRTAACVLTRSKPSEETEAGRANRELAALPFFGSTGFVFDGLATPGNQVSIRYFLVARKRLP